MDTAPPSPIALTSQSLSRSLARALSGSLGLAQRPLMRFATGQVVIQAGQPVLRLPVLASGRINAVMHSSRANGSQVVPIQFGPGEVVMLSYLFSEQLSSVDMVAAEPTTLHWAETREIEAAMLADPALAVMLIKFLGTRLREVQGRERSWVERSVQVRVASALVRMASDITPSNGQVFLRVTHEQIANRAGVSRPKASLAIKKLEKAGHIQPGRGVMHLLDLAALRRAAE
jgi:CRP-like cAMP-binding protein